MEIGCPPGRDEVPSPSLAVVRTGMGTHTLFRAGASADLRVSAPLPISARFGRPAVRRFLLEFTMAVPRRKTSPRAAECAAPRTAEVPDLRRGRGLGRTAPPAPRRSEDRHVQWPAGAEAEDDRRGVRAEGLGSMLARPASSRPFCCATTTAPRGCHTLGRLLPFFRRQR